MRTHTLALLALSVCLQPAIAADVKQAAQSPATDNTSQVAAKPAPKEFSIFGAAVYGPRTIGGTIFVDRTGPASSTATADSLGLGTENSTQFLLGARYDRWRLSFGYMPTNFTGDGTADVTLNIGNLPPIPLDMPVHSNIDVNLFLAHISYDIYQGEKWVWALGAGFGRTDIDIALTPRIGTPLAFDGSEPFGYIGGSGIWHFAPRWSATGTLQWISADFSGTDIDYGNYNLSLGYLLTEKHIRTEIIGGYRYVSFEFGYDVAGDTINTDLSLKGPYIGLGFSW